MIDDPMKQDFATDGPFSDIFRRLADLEKKMRDIQSNPIPTSVSDFAYMAGNGRTLQMITDSQGYADDVEHTLTFNWPTAFSSLDTAWFSVWNDFSATTYGIFPRDFSANVNGATLTIRGLGNITRKIYIRFFGIGVL